MNNSGTLQIIALLAAAFAAIATAQADAVTSHHLFRVLEPLAGRYAQPGVDVVCEARGQIVASSQPARLEHVTSYVLAIERSGSAPRFVKHLVVHFDSQGRGELICEKQDRNPGAITTVEVEQVLGGRGLFAGRLAGPVEKLPAGVDPDAYALRYDELYSQMARYREVYAETLRKYPPEKPRKQSVKLASTDGPDPASAQEEQVRIPAAAEGHYRVKSPWVKNLQKLFFKSVADTANQAEPPARGAR